RLRVLRQRREPAAQRCARPAFPLGTEDALDPERMRAADDEDAVEAAPPDRLEHAREELDLLRRRRAVSRRRTGREDDGVDQLQPASAAQRCWTFAMYVCVSCVGARPRRSTTVGPALYAASARSVRWKRSSISRR